MTAIKNSTVITLELIYMILTKDHKRNCL